jgi:hypothetical protein
MSGNQGLTHRIAKRCIIVELATHTQSQFLAGRREGRIVTGHSVCVHPAVGLRGFTVSNCELACAADCLKLTLNRDPGNHRPPVPAVGFAGRLVIRSRDKKNPYPSQNQWGLRHLQCGVGYRACVATRSGQHVYTSRRRQRDGEFLPVQPGASVSVTAERARGVGRRAFVFFCASRGGEAEFGSVRGGL